MLLPTGIIERLFANPDAQPNHSHAIAVVCRLCKSVDIYFLERTSRGYGPHDLVVLADPIRDTMDGPMLRCDQEACNALVPLIAQWGPDTTKAERTGDVKTWRWGHLRCPQGHFIEKPNWDLL
jgi:hypothetical protein